MTFWFLLSDFLKLFNAYVCLVVTLADSVFYYLAIKLTMMLIIFITEKP